MAQKEIVKFLLIDNPSQNRNQPIITLDLTKLPPITFQENFFNIQNDFPDHQHICTDGSKQGMIVGCAAVFQNQELLKCLSNEFSMYSAEAIAIDLAMNIIANHKSSKYIIQTPNQFSKLYSANIHQLLSSQDY